MPVTIVVVQLVAIAVLVVSTLETLRERPWWPRPMGRSPDRPPPRGSSPRERRWLHLGLALLLAGNVISLGTPEEEAAWMVSIVALVGGVVLVVVGLVRGPTEAELARYRAERGGKREDEV